MDIEKILNKHRGIVLEFSGGKDSLATLYLLKPWWDRITVLWVNTGDAFPETMAQLQAVENMVPHFTMLWTGQPKQIGESGYPTDVLPFWDSPFGRASYPGREFKLQAPTQCCWQNIWVPMHNMVVAMGATLVIRGQRKEEARRGPINSGHVEDGIEYFFPLENWTRLEVMKFLADNQVAVPDHYDFVDSSLDCQHCTAYLDENAGKFRYMEKYHPELNNEVKNRVRYILRAVNAEISHARAIVE